MNVAFAGVAVAGAAAKTTAAVFVVLKPVSSDACPVWRRNASHAFECFEEMEFRGRQLNGR